MAAGFVSIPCDTCRVRACVAEAVTRREVLFAWAADMSLGCEDYEPDYFHGVEGVLNVAVSGGSDGGRYDRRERYGAVCGGKGK